MFPSSNTLTDSATAMFRPSALLLVFVSQLSIVATQNFSVPSYWRVSPDHDDIILPLNLLKFDCVQKPTSTLSRSDRLGLLNGLINTVSRTFDNSSGLFSGIILLQNELCLIIFAYESGDLRPC